MNFVLQPWQFLLACLAGWINHEQQKVIDYLIAENRILKEKFGKKRILSNDKQRRILAVKGKSLGRKILQKIEIVFTPDTILRWHKQLVAQKWDYSNRKKSRVGRPRIRQKIVDLTVRLANENPDWGYKKIVGALENVAYSIAKSTVSNILKFHGIEPSPDREKRTKWSTFLKAYWESLGAIDFTTIEVWTTLGLITYYLLFVMKVSSRKVQFVGCTPNPCSFWKDQKTRNLTDPFDGFLVDVRKLILDRDSIFSKSFRDIWKQSDVSCVRLPHRSLDLNAYIERFMKTIKYECLEKMVLFGENSLRKVIQEFMEYYHKERNHQGIGNQIIEPGKEVLRLEGRIEKRERLGGMLNYYYREAA